jgi:hypothetical protein
VQSNAEQAAQGAYEEEHQETKWGWREGKGGNGAKSQNATEQTHVVEPAGRASHSAR